MAQIALDYHIDRPRVLAIRFDPVVVQAEVPVTIDALAVAPRGQVIQTVTAATCIEDPLAETTTYTDLSCFGEPKLEVLLGDIPAVWLPHGSECTTTTSSTSTSYYSTYYSDTGAGDTGGSVSSCESTLPILVEARTSDGSGFGSVFSGVPQRAIAVPGLWSYSQSLTASGQVRAGGEVQLDFEIANGDLSPSYPGFHWYVDAGELVKTGVTAPTSVEPDLTKAANTLRIPEDWHGPLRVIVVATASENVDRADTTWRVLVLDVP